MNASPLKWLCSIEYKTTTHDPVYGSEVITWNVLATVRCAVVDALPNVSESAKEGLVQNINTVQVTMRWRSDVDSSMRLVINRPKPVIYQITAGPAEVGFRQGLTMTAQTFSSAGG